MSSQPSELTPLPPDYYRSISSVEQRHWWHRGMRDVAAALLGDRLQRDRQSLLDIGCGTGGYLEWAKATGRFAHLAGVDVSAEALALAHERVPEAELALASAALIPFDDSSFDLVSLNDVLQHIHEDELAQSLAELRRVIRPGGALLLRTNGGRNGRRDAADWRLYDLASLRSELERGGFAVERITHANLILSVWGRLRGHVPRTPDAQSHGIPRPAGGFATAIGSRLLGLEARFLRGGNRRLPFGHTLLGLATPANGRLTDTSAGAFFDEESRRYDKVYEADSTGGRVLRLRLATVLRLVGDGPGNALDAGMGGGRLAQELDRRGWTVSGLDLSEQMVDLARRRLPHRRQSLVQGDIQALPFEPGSFDLAVATGVLEYANDLRGALRELARVTRPGGRVVISFPDYAAPYSLVLMRLWYPAMRVAKGIVPFGRPAPHRRSHLPAPGAVERLVAAAGLVLEEVVPLGPRPVPRAFARRLDGSGSHAERLLATQLVLAVRRPEGAA